MKGKKLFAALLAVVLMLGCLPLAANAANEPTTLYVGEKNKSDHNLIDRYDSEGFVKVMAIDKTSQAYYTVDKEKGVGYVLTFYNDYTMSEMVTDAPTYCGVYCDGDLTIRLAGNITFDTNDAKKKNAIGIFVEGQLTIEDALFDEYGNPLPSDTAHVLNVNGSKAKTKSSAGSIGICAPTIMLHQVTVNACGGYAGVLAQEALVMYKSNLNANTAADMKDGDDMLFTFSIQTDHYIQCGGKVVTEGDIDIQSYFDEFDGVKGEHSFDEKPVVYARFYKFAEDSYDGIWSDSFKLFKNPDAIPSCMNASISSSVAKIDRNDLTLNRRGDAQLALTIRCARTSLVFGDECKVTCRVVWWQWIPYILSGAWIGAFTD